MPTLCNPIFKIRRYYILLVFIILLMSACNSDDIALYDHRIIKITTVSGVNDAVNLTHTSFPSPTVVVTKENKFSEKKRKNINHLIIKNHYKSLDFNDIILQVKNPLSLNRYLHQLDPYSKYLSKKQYQFIQIRSLLKRVGAGFNLLINKDKVLLVPIPNTALYQAGLETPKYLHTINQHKIDYQDFSSYAFITDLKSGDTVDIAVQQTHIKKNYRITARKYSRKLDYYREYNGYAIMRIDEFREGMQKQLSRFLKKINNKKPLIIDLRYCPGGDLFTAVDMLSPFLGKSKTIAFLEKEKSYRPISLKSIKSPRLFTQPIYLLSSQFTASSAEVFIRGIKHSIKNSYIIGTSTQGKCFAQESYTLADKSALLLSSYKILSPDQKDCAQSPIIPDQSVPNIELLSIEQLMKQGVF